MSPSSAKCPLWVACGRLGGKALPTTLALAATTLSNTLAFSFVGRYAEESGQAAHGLGYSVANMLCLMIGFGLVGGLDSLCPQAVGRLQRWRCWAYLHQAICAVTVVFTVAAPLLWWSGDLLTLANQEPEFSCQVQLYLRAALPGLAFLCVFEALRKFLVYNGRIRAQNCVSVCSIGVQGISLWLLVARFRLGPRGAGIARSISAATSVVLLVSYLIYARRSMGWDEFCGRAEAKMVEPQASGSSSSTRVEVNLEMEGKERDCGDTRLWGGLWTFLKLAFPAALMCTSEWVSYEAMIVEATALGPVDLAALSTAQALSSLCFVASSALALQTTSEVGRCMGRKDVAEARQYAIAGLVGALCLPCCYAGVMIGWKSNIAKVFSNSNHVRSVFLTNLPLLVILVTVDCLHTCVCGVLKALGLAWYGAIFDLLGLLGVMQISGLLLAFYCNLRSAGFILGSIIGVGLSATSGLYFLAAADWNAIADAQAARERREEICDKQPPTIGDW